MFKCKIVKHSYHRPQCQTECTPLLCLKAHTQEVIIILSSSLRAQLQSCSSLRAQLNSRSGLQAHLKSRSSLRAHLNSRSSLSSQHKSHSNLRVQQHTSQAKEVNTTQGQWFPKAETKPMHPSQQGQWSSSKTTPPISSPPMPSQMGNRQLPSNGQPNNCPWTVWTILTLCYALRLKHHLSWTLLMLRLRLRHRSILAIHSDKRQSCGLNKHYSNWVISL